MTNQRNAEQLQRDPSQAIDNSSQLLKFTGDSNEKLDRILVQNIEIMQILKDILVHLQSSYDESISKNTLLLSEIKRQI